ncbi:BTAD domain-containing putative transcriptional regulator [Streptomyces sp. NPDC090046]|uniref:AfsR/SARP family transcriptional regulator n=1 Tax=Streptomyces sp. NPDC090046 TaxID=3365928 RepID=UPI003806420B
MNGDAHGVADGLTEVLAAVAGQICFSVLGTLGVSTGTPTPHTLRGPMVNKVMALLLLRAGQVVEVDTFVDELWEERPPRWALSTVRTHVYHLRRQLDEVLDLPSQQLLRTSRSGYLLDIDPEQLDATRFTRLFGESERLLARNRPDEAVDACREGLALWQGRALATVRPGRVLTGHVQYLEELRVRAHQVRVEAEMRRGRHTHLVPELRGLVAAHPFNEWFHHSLIESLRESGRRGEALSAFQALRTMLRDELGLEPADGASWRVPA